MKKKVDIFLILCLKLLQVKKAISYHLIQGFSGPALWGLSVHRSWLSYWGLYLLI